jgi:hypothetical protein
LLLSIQRMGSGRPGAAIWKACPGTRYDAFRQESIAWSLSGFPGDFERLCHAAINFQI